MSAAAQQVAAPESTSTSIKHRYITRLAAHKRLSFMGLPKSTAHTLRQKVNNMPAIRPASGDSRHILPDHHLICPIETAQLLFTCPNQRAAFLGTDWSQWLSKNCKSAVACAPS